MDGDGEDVDMQVSEALPEKKWFAGRYIVYLGLVHGALGSDPPDRLEEPNAFQDRESSMPVGRFLNATCKRLHN